MSNYMQPRIEKLRAKKLVGLHVKMSLSDNKTGQLWGQFGPWVKEIENRISTDKISLQIYPSNFYDQFSPHKEFVKWAAVEVQDFEHMPKGMDSLVLDDGLYAVFDYKGSSADNSIFQHIFFEWLPSSNYQLADRPHFEILGANYRNNDPESEEEIWVPVVEQG